MRARELVLRCYAEKIDDQWQAFCLDFTLAAQAPSSEEARRSLEAMISEYVYDALAGEDQQFADQLLRRRAPLKYWVKFYTYALLYKIGALHHEIKQFCPLVPLEPKNYNHA